MKLLSKLEEKRPFLKLYHDDGITEVNVNRLLSQDVSRYGLKELQDVVKAVKASTFITHFSHHSSENLVQASFNAKQSMAHLQSQLDPNVLSKQPQLQQNTIRQNVQQQMGLLQNPLLLFSQISQLITQMLPDNKSITHLDLSKTFMGDDLASTLAKMFVDNQILAHLNLSYNSLKEKGGIAIGQTLSNNESLTHLDLSHNTLAHKVLEVLAKSLASSIKMLYLNLSYNPQSVEESSHHICTILENSKLITHLDIGHMNLGVAGMHKILTVLRTYTALKYLNIASNNLDINSAEHLASLLSSEDSVIEHLDISENRLTIEGLTILVNALKSNTTLRCLDMIQMEAYGENGGKCIAILLTTNKTIAILNIGNNNLNYIGIKLIAEALKTNQSLAQIGIGHNGLDEGGGIYMAKALETNGFITKLDLKDNNIQCAGAIYLADSLSKNKYVQHLNLSNNQIYDDGIEASSSLLSRIVTLDLSNNQITVLGAKFLAEGLEKARTLTVLILDNNPLQSEGVEAILLALRENYSLKTLGLSATSIGNAGIENCAKLLHDNIGIAKLDLGANSITASGAKFLAKLLQDNTSLSALCLNGNSLTPEGEASLQEALLFSSLIVLTGVVDQSGKICTALSKNMDLFQQNLRKLQTDQNEGFNFKTLYTLIQQILSRSDSVPAELSYADLQGNGFYLTKIAEIFKIIKSEKSSSLNMSDLMHSNDLEVTDDRYFLALEGSEVLGNINIHEDMF